MLDSWWLYRFFRITLLHHSCLVFDLVVEAFSAVHGAVDGPISAVAVLVVRQLFGQLTSAVTRQLFQQPPVVGGDDGGHDAAIRYDNRTMWRSKTLLRTWPTRKRLSKMLRKTLPNLVVMEASKGELNHKILCLLRLLECPCWTPGW